MIKWYSKKVMYSFRIFKNSNDVVNCKTSQQVKHLNNKNTFVE